MGAGSFATKRPVLDPIERIAEILFGLIMALTFTGSLAAWEAGHADVREMLIAALGCNVAWGVIDAALYLMGCLAESGRGLIALRAARAATTAEAARAAIAGVLPPLVAETIEPAHLDAIREKLLRLPEPPAHARLTASDWLGALAVFLLVTVSVTPVALPFVLLHDPVIALHVSNAVALAMLFLLGHELGRRSGRSAWMTGLVMVFVGAVLVAMTMALGG